MITALGAQTPKTIILKEEMHKLHEEFSVNSDVLAGQPVKLTTVEGAVGVAPMGAADPSCLCIGYAMNDAKAAIDLDYIQGTGHLGLVTVIMKAFVIVRGIADGAVEAGPVKYSGVSSATSGDNLGVCKYKALVAMPDPLVVPGQDITLALSGNAESKTVAVEDTELDASILGDILMGVGTGWALDSVSTGEEIYVALAL